MRAVAGVAIVGAFVFAAVAQGQSQAQGQAGQTGQTQGQGRGQGRGQAEPPKNLQILPKDIPRQQLLATMRGFTAALGVECQHCHVSQQDRASDDKPQKLIARKMLKMVAAINDEYLKDVGMPAEPGESKVTCFTCHRGALKPLTAPSGGGIYSHWPIRTFTHPFTH